MIGRDELTVLFLPPIGMTVPLLPCWGGIIGGIMAELLPFEDCMLFGWFDMKPGLEL